MSTLLIAGHPGHEVRCHGWLSRTRPLALVLTSGGGQSKQGRVASTRRVLEEAGATCGPLMGSFSDVEVYDFMRRGEAGPLAEWTEAAARVVAEHRPDVVLTDMVEGYNPSHDLVAYLARYAVERAAALGWRPARLLCQPLEGRPDRAWGGKLRPAETIVLTDGELQAKIAAARGYPELADEVERAISELSAEAFRLECLYEAPAADEMLGLLPEPKPHYEVHGERQVAAGKYREVIRHADHLVPLARRVRSLLGAA